MKVKEKKIKLIDEIELSYEYMLQYEIKSKIIAVTGTNGKTTTTSKITELLQYAGFKAEYAGNIGVSFAEVLLKYKDLDFKQCFLPGYIFYHGFDAEVLMSSLARPNLRI